MNKYEILWNHMKKNFGFYNCLPVLRCKEPILLKNLMNKIESNLEIKENK